jgi:hypothetical protein
MANEVPDTIESHHDAAAKFFPAGDVPPAAPEPIVAPPVPVAPVTKKPGVLDSIVTPPAAPAPVAPVEPVLEPIDKGLQAPPPNAASRAGWDKLKEIAANERLAKLELAKKVAEYEAKLKTATPVAADEATIARLKQLEEENTAFSSRLKVLDLKSHPEYQAKFVLPAQAAKNALAALAKTEEVDVNVDELLSLKGRALNAGVSEAMDRMTPYGRVKFQAALDSYISTTVAAEEALGKADEFLKSSSQLAGSRSRESFEKVSTQYAGIFRALPVDDTVPAEDRPQVEAYNASLSGVRKRAEALAFGQIDEAGVADLAHKAALYEFSMTQALPRLGRIFENEIAGKDARIVELEKQVAGLTNAAPKLEGGSGSLADAPTGDETHLAAAGRYFK